MLSLCSDGPVPDVVRLWRRLGFRAQRLSDLACAGNEVLHHRREHAVPQRHDPNRPPRNRQVQGQNLEAWKIFAEAQQRGWQEYQGGAFPKISADECGSSGRSTSWRKFHATRTERIFDE